MGEQSRLLKINMQIEDQSIPIEIDTGAGLSLVSELKLPTGSNGQTRLWNRAVNQERP